jgi:manganese/iron transport system permease protein
VTGQDLAVIAAVAGVVVVALALLHKELELTSVDPTHAHVIGLRPDRLRYLLLVLLSFTVVAGVQAVGVLLTSALLITPAAAASLMTDRLPRMMAIAVGIALVSSLVGLYASYYLSVASGAAIVLSCTFWFALAWLVRAGRGAAARQAAQRP